MEILPFVSFLTGVVSVLSPCILPVIPLFVAFSFKSKTKSETASFVLGFIIIFAALILLTGFFTSLVYAYIPYIRIFSAVILLAIAILMLIDYSFSFRTITPKDNEGIAESFIMGLLTSVAWAPCFSPYLISLISLLVSSNNGLYAILNLILYCFGFALTLFVLSMIISRIDLEKLISKTRHIPKIFAFLILISAIYLLWESLKILI